ncbi:hypothetical protein EV645_3345 [Kribbella rubisoli]|uniref:Twin-arginine translocation signal domain-containing protein n=1 Tax=Kribbella rubisoli TaxID=3075929 RepID=A0A4Q7WZ05_9ACTN|nr:hypothetical protein [Kribbella rubisoli]RZU15807.1 hypothetical protein EV645_3345 [Kribbella rubisoli]
MTSSTPPDARVSRRVFLAAAAAVSAAGYLQIPSAPAATAATAATVVASEPRPHNTLLGLL